MIHSIRLMVGHYQRVTRVLKGLTLTNSTKLNQGTTSQPTTKHPTRCFVSFAAINATAAARQTNHQKSLKESTRVRPPLVILRHERFKAAGMTRCPLCYSDQVRPFADHSPSTQLPNGRLSCRCTNCQLIFVLPQFHLDLTAQQLRYDQHQNHNSQEGYVHSLQLLIKPLMEQAQLIQQYKNDLDTPLIGLDFGCGPAPVLSELIQRDYSRCQMKHYDPIYFPDHSLLLNTSYDFIACNEVAEHFTEPRQEFERFSNRGLIHSNGLLAISTRSPPNELIEAQLNYHSNYPPSPLNELNFDTVNSHQSHSPPFVGWWYARDPTHITFYSDGTFRWIEQQFGWRRLYYTNDLWIGQRTDRGG